MARTILFDIDDTLNNLVEVWINLYNEQYNDTLSIDDILTYSIEDYVKPEVGLKIYDILDTPNLFSELVSPVKGSIEVLEELNNDPNYDIIIVSSCLKQEHYDDKLKFLKKHYPFLDTSKFYSSASGEKYRFLSSDGVMVDDNPHNFKNFDGLAFMPNYAYNRGYDRVSMVRIDSLKEILEYLNQ